jgi:hypothetical protein
MRRTKAIALIPLGSGFGVDRPVTQSNDRPTVLEVSRKAMLSTDYLQQPKDSRE